MGGIHVSGAHGFTRSELAMHQRQKTYLPPSVLMPPKLTMELATFCSTFWRHQASLVRIDGESRQEGRCFRFRWDEDAAGALNAAK